MVNDGIRGHLFQSRGVAGWLVRDFGMEEHEVEIPRLRGWRRGMFLKVWAVALRWRKAAVAARWLAGAGGTPLQRSVEAWAQERHIPLSKLLFLSAGSAAAPFALALARCTGARCATLMTPSVLGTGPFDAAVVPRHDAPAPSPRTFITLGAPNAIVTQNLAASGEELLRRFPSPVAEGPSEVRERWALLLGGDDGNYRIPPLWVSQCVGAALSAAAERGAELYITTSRRTSAEAEEALLRSVGHSPVVRMCLLASRDPWNPVPGMLGVAHRVFCTEDSVSMVSEAISGGHRVGLLRVARRGGFREWWTHAGATLARWGVRGESLGGVLRFDALFEEFFRRGYAVEFDENFTAWPWDRVGRFDTPPPNEARNAAGWLWALWERP